MLLAALRVLMQEILSTSLLQHVKIHPSTHLITGSHRASAFKCVVFNLFNIFPMLIFIYTFHRTSAHIKKTSWSTSAQSIATYHSSMIDHMPGFSSSTSSSGRWCENCGQLRSGMVAAKQSSQSCPRWTCFFSSSFLGFYHTFHRQTWWTQSGLKKNPISYNWVKNHIKSLIMKIPLWNILKGDGGSVVRNVIKSLAK